MNIDSHIGRRTVLVEKYPHAELKEILRVKNEFIQLRKYEDAAKYRDLEKNFYRDKFGYDIVREDVYNISAVEFLTNNNNADEYVKTVMNEIILSIQKELQ